MGSPTDDLRLPPLDLPKCAFVGCNEMPTERLPGRDLLACKPHTDRFRAIVAERDYSDFVRFLRDQGITDLPVLTDDQEAIEARRCCVPGCDGKVISGKGFEPFKQPGQAWVCQAHYDPMNAVARRQNAERLIRELSGRPIDHVQTTQLDLGSVELTSSEYRSRLVAQVMKELNNLKHQLYVPSDYARLRSEHADYLTFQVTEANGDLRARLQHIMAHRQHTSLAIQIVASLTGKAEETIKIDWRKHEPKEFRQHRKSRT